MNEPHLIAKIADMKEVDYRNTLAVASLIELCIEKGVFTKGEFSTKALQLDQETMTQWLANQKPSSSRQRPRLRH